MAIIYYGGSTKLYSMRVNILFDEFKDLVRREISWNFILLDVDITWKTLGGSHPNRYVDVPNISYISFNVLV